MSQLEEMTPWEFQAWCEWRKWCSVFRVECPCPSEEEIAAMFALRNAQEPMADEVIDSDCSPGELRRKVDAALRRAKLI